jgi:metal-responsive CopG/Arc/MetJ family transcriptional regulator
MKTAISIPDSIFQSADALAKQLGISRSELYAKAVAEYLSRHHGEQITARLDAIHGQEDSRVEPALGQLQARALPREALW